MSANTVVVCGATGQQGSRVVEHLAKSERWAIVALTRDPQSEKSRALAEAGHEIRAADLLDGRSLIAAFEGAHAVFGVTQPWTADYKKCFPAREVEQGRNIVNACREAGVGHLVLSTALHEKKGRTGVPHVDSKLTIEDYALEEQVPCTIVGPASFMDNIGQSFFPVKEGKVRGFVDGDARVPYVACDDIGAFVACVLADPDQYIGRTVDLAGDFISGDELAATLSELRDGQQFRYKTVPKLLMRLFAKEFYAMRLAFEAMGRPPYSEGITAALEDSRQRCPGIKTVAQHLEARGYRTKRL